MNTPTIIFGIFGIAALSILIGTGAERCYEVLKKKRIARQATIARKREASKAKRNKEPIKDLTSVVFAKKTFELI